MFTKESNVYVENKGIPFPYTFDSVGAQDNSCMIIIINVLPFSHSRHTHAFVQDLCLIITPSSYYMHLHLKPRFLPYLLL